MKRLHLNGKRFGRLTVVSDSGQSTDKKAALHDVTCTCGKGLLVDSTHLTSGQTLSCGCARLEQLDRVRTPLPGEQNPTHKLTDDDVISIRLMYGTGEWTQQELADQFNVWQSCISKVLLGKNWQHVV